MGLIVLLPVIGLTAITPLLLLFLSLWLVNAASAFIAVTFTPEFDDAQKHTFVSLYLYLSCFTFAAFVARNPLAHAKLVLNGWTFAAIIAGSSGLVGYFNLLPGADELFTKFGRAAGTFKDPNVFGPFLVAPIVYTLHLMIHTSRKRVFLIALTAAGILSLALLLSFSRGAWVCLAAAIALYAVMALLTAPTVRQKARITSMLFVGALAMGIVVAVAVQLDEVSKLLEDRANLVNSYDTGTDGRFGGQIKAIGLIAENPAGLGAQTFAVWHHTEEVHNVYLNVLMNGGWLGGGIYWIIVALTIWMGFRHLTIPSPARPLFAVAFATFLATALEGLIIDTDHWRHFYMLLSIIWGIMAVHPAAHGNEASTPAT